MPALMLCAPLTQVTLSCDGLQLSVPVNGQRRIVCRKSGAPVMPWPDDCALKPDGQPETDLRQQIQDVAALVDARQRDRVAVGVLQRKQVVRISLGAARRSSCRWYRPAD